MNGKMNAGQRRVSRKIRAFCKHYAFKAQFDFLLVDTGYRGTCLCESGVVTVWVGAVIDPWRDFPTRKLQQLLDGARRQQKERELKAAKV